MVDQEATQIARVGGEHDTPPRPHGMGGDDRVDPAGQPAPAVTRRHRPQVPGPSGRRLVGDIGPQPADRLVHRRISGSTRDRLGEDHGRDNGIPPVAHQLAQHHPEPTIDGGPVEDSCIEDDDGVGHPPT